MQRAVVIIQMVVADVALYAVVVADEVLLHAVVMDMDICIIQIGVADLGAFGVIFILFRIRVSGFEWSG